VARHLVICISEVLHSQGCGLFDFANSLLDQVSALSQACSSCGGQAGSPGNQSNLTFSVSHRETTVSSMRVFSGQALLLDSGNGARVEVLFNSSAWPAHHLLVVFFCEQLCLRVRWTQMRGPVSGRRRSVCIWCI
jgi:hypothetical protein